METSMDAKCEHCPYTGKAHEGKEASVFMMCVVNIPGRVPYIVTTPKHIREVTDSSPCGICNLVDELTRYGVLHGAVDIAKEIRQHFTLKAGECSDSSNCEQHKAVGDCGGRLPDGPGPDPRVRPEAGVPG